MLPVSRGNITQIQSSKEMAMETELKLPSSQALRRRYTVYSLPLPLKTADLI